MDQRPGPSSLLRVLVTKQVDLSSIPQVVLNSKIKTRAKITLRSPRNETGGPEVNSKTKTRTKGEEPVHILKFVPKLVHVAAN